jgi:hypothetical protein
MPLSEYRATAPEMWGQPQIHTETLHLPGDGADILRSTLIWRGQ